MIRVSARIHSNGSTSNFLLRQVTISINDSHPVNPTSKLPTQRRTAKLRYRSHTVKQQKDATYLDTCPIALPSIKEAPTKENDLPRILTIYTTLYEYSKSFDLSNILRH